MYRIPFDMESNLPNLCGATLFCILALLQDLLLMMTQPSFLNPYNSTFGWFGKPLHTMEVCYVRQ